MAMSKGRNASPLRVARFEGTRQTSVSNTPRDAGGVGDYTVEVEQDGVVVVTRDRIFGFGLPRSRSICFAHSVVLPVSTVRR